MKLPAVPLTVEGSAVLHQMMRIRWSAWRILSEADQQSIAAEAAAVLGDGKCTAPYAMLGHKSDLMLVHFRKNFEELAAVQLRGTADHPFWPRIAWSPDSQTLVYETVEGGDALYSQGIEESAGERRLVGYGRHPAWR